MSWKKILKNEGKDNLESYNKKAEEMESMGYEKPIPKYIVISDQSTFNNPIWDATITDAKNPELGEGSILDVVEGIYDKSEYSAEELIEAMKKKYPTSKVIGPAKTN